MKNQTNRHMFNISEIIVAPCTIILLTNQYIGMYGPRQLVDVTKDRAMVGQLRERILVFHPACAYACTHACNASRVFSFFLLASFHRVGALCEPDIRHTTTWSVGWDAAVSEEGEI